METRREVLEFGLLPIGQILPWVDSLQVVTDLHLKLLVASRPIEGKKGVIDLQLLLNHLSIGSGVWDVLYDALDVVSSKPVGFKWPGRSEIHSIDAHAFSLFLMLQMFGQQLQRGDREDWQDRASDKNPNTTDTMPHSPGGRAAGPQRAHSILSLPSFLRRRIQVLLFLVLDNPPPMNSSAWAFSRGQTSINSIMRRNENRLWVTAFEVDRLGLLLRPKEQTPEMNGIGGAGSMVPGIGDWKRLSSWMPCFRGKAEDHQVACEEVANWLVANILDDDLEKTLKDSDEASVKITGMSKGTVVRGEEGFPSKELHVVDCQDSCIYALAPLARVRISACTECTIVIGAAQCLIVSSCTKVRLICTCWRMQISSCHECTIYLGTNRPPVLYGDNRYLQLGPYNTSYERLPIHMRQMGINGSSNLWDQPMVLSRQRNSEDGDATSVGQNSSTANGGDLDAYKYKGLLLPPDNLLPFTIPFKGSAGQLAGGSSSVSQLSWLGKGGVDAPGIGRSPGLPFTLPPAYLDAMMMKLRKVTELQESVGKAIVDSSNRRDLHVAIQGYFKDWLFSSGRIRQVYDLARLEQQIIADRKSSSSSKKQSKSS